jgi:glycosyltransferase A (GT-A) superfamily protein (DUF2064 family)
MPIEDLNLAISVSAEWDVLLGPTFDGGYYLIAMSRSLPEVFEGVEWREVAPIDQAKILEVKVDLLCYLKGYCHQESIV